MRRGKYFQFSLRSVLAVTGLIALAMWWVQWPSATATAFAHDPQSFHSDGRLMDPTSDIPAFAHFVASDDTPAIDPEPRSIGDCLFGQQTFYCGKFRFTVVRGAIARGPYNAFKQIEEALK